MATSMPRLPFLTIAFLILSISANLGNLGNLGNIGNIINRAAFEINKISYPTFEVSIYETLSNSMFCLNNPRHLTSRNDLSLMSCYSDNLAIYRTNWLINQEARLMVKEK
jgi:hypothetical protein